MYASSRESSKSRPDRGLKVEVTFDRRVKNITFTSIKNVRYDLLCAKVEKAFSLKSYSYAIAFKDDDGEVSTIQTNDELEEAVQYFDAGVDDRMSIISGFSNGSYGSFGSRHRITLKVYITVDFDGRLSDTGSIAPSDDDFGHRPRSMDSFSMSGSLSAPLEDDQRTISSRDRQSLAQPAVTKIHAPGSLSISDGEGGDNVSYLARDEQYERARAQDQGADLERRMTGSTGVFERLRRDQDSLPEHYRKDAWFQEQDKLAREAHLGRTPPPSDYRFSLSSDASLPAGELALERNSSGRFYYAYTSSSRSRSSIGSAAALSRAQSRGHHQHRQSGLSLSSLPPIPEPSSDRESGSQFGSGSGSGLKSTPKAGAANYATLYPDIPPELLAEAFQDVPGAPPEAISECSACSQPLSIMRYVCATCGPRKKSARDGCTDGGPHKGKGRDSDARSESAAGSSPSLYPPTGWGGMAAASHSSQTLVGEQRLRVQTSTSTLGVNGRAPGSPPGASPGSTLHSPAGSMRSRGTSPPGANLEGYELCLDCLQDVGVVHALDAGLAPGAPSPSVTSEHHLHSPSEPHRSFSEWKRSAPRLKGQLRHAYLEQMLGPNGWEDLEHGDDGKTTKCSTCASVILRKRYKCSQCERFNLCKACYSQVHEIHPSHVFLEVRDVKARSKSDSDSAGEAIPVADVGEGISLHHPGVRCAHCMQDIVGARFHCAICDDIDICFNCESAGLPGNLDPSDGGHSSQHIMIKIPVPLENSTVESLSRQTVHLWTGRDAPHLGDDTGSRERSGSVHSTHRTVVAPGSGPSLTRAILDGETAEHNNVCDNCEQPIVGIRYQCATCPSAPASYNLCSSCEPRSYIVHDPMHIFFKLPRPVHKALASARPFVPPLYKTPAGPGFGNADPSNPNYYLRNLLHSAIACDRCMERIRGEWYWCAYCAKDLCDEHEEVDTHDNTHVFIVFKSAVDMGAFKRFSQSDNQQGGPRVIPYPIYFA